jgi:hypothetical protein
MGLVTIPPERISEAWDDLSPFLAAGLLKGRGELDLSQLRLLCVQRAAEVLAYIVDGKPRFAVAFEYLNYPNMRVANVISVGGAGVVALEETWEELKRFLRDERACQQVRGFVQPSGARLWKRLGVKELYRVIGADL